MFTATNKNTKTAFSNVITEIYTSDITDKPVKAHEMAKHDKTKCLFRHEILFDDGIKHSSGISF